MSFTPAKLYIPPAQAKDQRWFISYWAYDEAKSKRQRQKEFDVNEYNTDRERQTFAKSRISAINDMLSRGFVTNSSEKKAEREKQEIIQNSHKLSVEKAVELFLKSQEAKKSRGSTIKEYKNTLNAWRSYLLKEEGLANPNLFSIGRRDVKNYLDWMILEKELSARTRNNHLGAIKTLFYYVYDELYEDDQVHSPLEKISKIEETLGRNIAFSDDQILELTRYMNEHFPQQLFLCQFMYYTLARTKEISQLQVKHFGMRRSDCLFIPAEIAKNKHDRYVEITPAFAAAIERSGILKAPKEHYLFSDNYVPGPNKKGSGNMPRRFTHKVLRRLGYGEDYTLYSWKHTGVIKAFKANMSQAAIQTQMGHTNSESFQTYIKSLGLLENKEFVHKMPALPF